MNEILTLIKINFINSFKLKNSNPRKKLGIAILIIYVVGALGATLGMFLNGLFDTLEKVNLVSFYIPLMFSIASLFALFFTIFSAKGWLFENKDNDLLLSLPIKKSSILFSRYSLVVFYNLIISLLFVVPGLYIYLSSVAVTPIFYFSIIIMTLFLPIIPSIISCIFGYLIAFITSKVNKRNVTELISYVVFIALYMLLIGNANQLIIKLTSDVKLLNTILNTLFLPITLINKGIIGNNFLYMLLYIALNLGLLTIFILVLNKSYFKILSKLGSHKTKSNYKMTTLKTTSKYKALKQKEIKRYFSSAIYVFNTLFGMILVIIAGVGSLFFSSAKLLSLADMDGSLGGFALVFCLLAFAISMTVTTNSSISIERNNFWILKALPISTKEIFSSKLFVNRIIVIPIVLISLIFFKVSGYITFAELLLLSIFGVLLNIFVSNFGLIANLLLPKLDAINDTVVVKQSAASLMGMVVPLFMAIILIGVVLTLELTSISVLCIAVLITLIFSIASYILLYTWGIKRFNQIS